MRFKLRFTFTILLFMLLTFVTIPFTSTLKTKTPSLSNMNNENQFQISSSNTFFEELPSTETGYFKFETTYGNFIFHGSSITINYLTTSFTLQFPGSSNVNPKGIQPVDFHRTIMKNHTISYNENFYSQLVYEELYPGISLYYNIINGNLKYEFEVSAGADYKHIKLKYDADSVEVLPKSIILTDNQAALSDSELMVYYKNSDQLIKSNYRYDEVSNIISYDLGDVDETQSFIIDPIYEQYSSFYGGIGDDRGIAWDFAAYGDIWVAGRSDHIHFDDLRDYLPPNEDSFVNRWNIDYTELKNSFLIEGNGVDWVYDVVVSPSEKVFILVYTTSTDLVVTSDLRSQGNNESILLIVLSASGIFQSSTLIDGNGLDVGYSIKFDFLSRPIIVGETNSTNFENQIYLLEPNPDGINGFMMIFSQTATSIAHTLIVGGSEYDSISQLIMNEEDDMIIVMQSRSTELSGTISYFPSSVDPDSSGQDIHIIKISPSLDLIFDIRFGGSSVDYVTDITQDFSRNLVVVGYTFSFDFPTKNAFQPFSGSQNDDILHSTDGWIARFSQDGQEIQLSTYVGGKYFDRISAVRTDSHESIDFVGNTQSPDLPEIGHIRHNWNPEYCTVEEFNHDSSIQYPCEDIMVGQLSSNGNATILSYYGSPEKYDTASQLHIDSGNHYRFIGSTSGYNFPSVGGGFNATYNGGSSDLVIVYLKYVFLIEGDNPLAGNPVKAFWKMIGRLREELPSINFTGIFVLASIILTVRYIYHKKFHNKNKEVNTEMYPTKSSNESVLRVRPINIMK